MSISVQLSFYCFLFYLLLVSSLVDDLDLKSFIYKGYGKEMAKKHKMSPDAFIQLVMHLSYYR